MNWLEAKGFRIFGETSKSYAVIDYVAIVGDRTEVYVSEIQNRFQAGENITVVDNNNFTVYFEDGEAYVQNQGYEIPMAAMPLTEKITGIVSAITLNPNYKGLFYNTGDPVVAYGGLDPNRVNPVGLSAEVGDTNLGSLSALVVVNPSHGYRLPPNTLISITGSGGSNAAAQISLLDESKFANLTLVTSNTLGAVASVLLGNTTHPVTYTFGGGVIALGNTNTTLANTLNFKTFVVAPIGSVQITNSGKNYSGAPTIIAQSNYTTDFGTDDFSVLGILQPIRILNGGVNYGNSNTITIVGGTGFGAYANIRVNAAGSIVSANYRFETSDTANSAYPLGGLGYEPNYLPTVNVFSLSGSNASLIIPGVMAVGATFSPTTDTIGSIETINIIDGGEDYVSTPNLSLKVADVAVSNVSLLYPITSGDLIYQGTTANTNYYAYVDSTLKLSTAAPPNTANDVYQIRTYNYVGSYNSTLPLKIDKDVNANTYTLVMPSVTSYVDQFGNPTSIKRYGDGTAKATASFLGGVVSGEGKYLNDDGWISSLGRVLESKNYNKYTYVLSTTQALAKYKELVLNLVHPSGTRLIGRNLLKAANSFIFTSSEAFQNGYPLSYVAGSAAYATLSVISTSSTISNNIIKLTNVIAGNIGNTIFANDFIEFTATNNIRAYSTITRVDWSNNQIYMQDNVFLTFANVAFASISSSSNVININTLTGQYNGNFRELTPANSIFFVGDTISLNNGGTFYTITKRFANGNFSINNSSLGPIANTRITVNKNANTQSVMIYGDVGLYNTPELITEDGYSLLTESGLFILIG